MQLNDPPKMVHRSTNKENQRAFWRKYVKAIILDDEGKIDEIIFF